MVIATFTYFFTSLGDIYLNFIIDILPKSKRYEAIFVVEERLSKHANYFPLKHPYLAKSIVVIFAVEVVRLNIWNTKTYVEGS